MLTFGGMARERKKKRKREEKVAVFITKKSVKTLVSKKKRGTRKVACRTREGVQSGGGEE